MGEVRECYNVLGRLYVWDILSKQELFLPSRLLAKQTIHHHDCRLVFYETLIVPNPNQQTV